MPSVELVCVGQRDPVSLPALPFAVRAGPELVSDRGPRPLFQRDFDGLSGWMYHLGNPDCGTPGYGAAFFAFDLLSRRSQDHGATGLLEFAPGVALAVRALVAWLLAASPEGRVMFTTDWQFGPADACWFPPVSEAEFWAEHDAGRLRLNSLYPICLAAESQSAPDTSRKPC